MDLLCHPISLFSLNNRWTECSSLKVDFITFGPNLSIRVVIFGWRSLKGIWEVISGVCHCPTGQCWPSLLCQTFNIFQNYIYSIFLLYLISHSKMAETNSGVPKWQWSNDWKVQGGVNLLENMRKSLIRVEKTTNFNHKRSII